MRENPGQGPSTQPEMTRQPQMHARPPFRWLLCQDQDTERPSAGQPAPPPRATPAPRSAGLLRETRPRPASGASSVFQKDHYVYVSPTFQLNVIIDPLVTLYLDQATKTREGRARVGRGLARELQAEWPVWATLKTKPRLSRASPRTLVPLLVEWGGSGCRCEHTSASA